LWCIAISSRYGFAAVASDFVTRGYRVQVVLLFYCVGLFPRTENAVKDGGNDFHFLHFDW